MRMAVKAAMSILTAATSGVTLAVRHRRSGKKTFEAKLTETHLNGISSNGLAQLKSPLHQHRNTVRVKYN